MYESNVIIPYYSSALLILTVGKNEVNIDFHHTARRSSSVICSFSIFYEPTNTLWEVPYI